MVNHGISTGALFLLVGMIYERRHTREIAELKGLQKVGADLRRRVHGRDAVVDRPARAQRLRRRVPHPAGLVLTRRWWAVVAATGVILAALYLLWAYQRVFHGEPDEDNADFADLSLRGGPGAWPRSSASSCSSASTPSRSSTASSRRSTALVAHVEDSFTDVERQPGRRRGRPGGQRTRPWTSGAEADEADAEERGGRVMPLAPRPGRRRPTPIETPGGRLVGAAPVLILIGGAVVLLVAGRPAAAPARRSAGTRSSPCVVALGAIVRRRSRCGTAVQERRARCSVVRRRGRRRRLLAVPHRRDLRVGRPRRPAGRRLPAPRGPRGARALRPHAAVGRRAA